MNWLIRRHASKLGWSAGLLLLCLDPRPSDACGWDYETFHAEAESLPCVFDAVVGAWPKHTAAYDEKRIAAFDAALAWAPHWTEALDAKALSQIRLGDLAAADETLQHRMRVDPEAYASHANLGSLRTFQGRWDEALKYIDRALTIEPKAHFGREKVHRKLVEFMRRVGDPLQPVTTDNFLGITFEASGRLEGSPARFAESALGPEVFDALVSMITVYGGDGVPELYLALGEALSLRGDLRLAYAAYRRAEELGHPRKEDLARWQREILEEMRERYVAQGHAHLEAYVGIDKAYKKERQKGRILRRTYAKWEKRTIRRGTPVWTRGGLDVIYAQMDKSRRRCQVPSVIDQAPTRTVPPPKGKEHG